MKRKQVYNGLIHTPIYFLWPVHHSGSHGVREPISYVCCCLFCVRPHKKKTTICTFSQFKVFAPYAHFWLPVGGSRSAHADSARTCKLHTERSQTQALNPQPSFCEGPAPTTAPLCHPGLIHFSFSTTFYFLTHSHEMECMSSSVREVLEPLVFHASLSSIVWSGSVLFVLQKKWKRDIDNHIKEIEQLHSIKPQCYIWPDTLSLFALGCALCTSEFRRFMRERHALTVSQWVYFYGQRRKCCFKSV